jgi:hypothetical protein
MFSVIAFVIGTVVAWRASTAQEDDPDDVPTNIKHTRQDLRLIAWLLYAILIALGVIADRLH